MNEQLTPADGTDEHTVQQDNELEALASIFGEDFQDLRNKDPWKVRLARRTEEHRQRTSWKLCRPVCHSRVRVCACACLGQEATRGLPLFAAQWAE